jgi:hypothetical protein
MNAEQSSFRSMFDYPNPTSKPPRTRPNLPHLKKHPPD